MMMLVLMMMLVMMLVTAFVVVMMMCHIFFPFLLMYFKFLLQRYGKKDATQLQKTQSVLFATRLHTWDRLILNNYFFQKRAVISSNSPFPTCL